MSFSLDPRLADECVSVAELGVSTLLLRDDRRFPWLILVPRREGATELHVLNAGDRAAVMEEIAAASSALMAAAPSHKINVGALGNIVRQLHIHIIGRNPDDAAWPGPVWGVGEREPYSPALRDALAAKIRDNLAASSVRVSKS